MRQNVRFQQRNNPKCQSGPRRIGEIMPEVLARYGLGSDCLCPEGSVAKDFPILPCSIDSCAEQGAFHSLVSR